MLTLRVPISTCADFGSLHQHPEGGTRTPSEDALFRQALGGLGALYAHQYTIVVRITALPADYPHAYHQLGPTNASPYSSRGWCQTEANWAKHKY